MAGASSIEPAGAERFRAVSFPHESAKAPPPVAVPLAPESIEDRLAALEAMVHELALHTLSASTHPGVIAWMKGIGAKIKAEVEKVF